MLGGLRIRTKLLLVVIVPLVALVVMAAAGFVVLREARVGGPRFDQIDQSKNLVADVLPPPAFIVESYLTTQQIAAASGSEITRLTARLNSQEAAYQDTLAKWDQLETDPAIRAKLLTDAKIPADRFFELVETEFLPAIQARDADAAAQALTGEMEAAFEQHRLAIVELVQLAQDRETSVRDDSISFVNRSQFVLLAFFLVVLGLAVALGTLVARSIVRPVQALYRIATKELPETIEALKTADIESGAAIEIPKIDLGTRDELGDAATAFNEVVSTAVGLAGDQSKLRQHTADLMINLGKRNQVLLGSQLELLDRLEGDVQEPALLDGLFELDHLATRMRRNAESLLVLAGSRRSRSWAKPVLLSEVIQGAVSELSDYRRVDVVVPSEDDLPVSGQHTVDVAHLLAEVIENALQFSPPSTQVLVRTQRSRAGVRVWVSDLGIGMSEAELVTANDRISRPPEIDELNADQVGFLVIARLSLRIEARVKLQPNPAGGLAANIDLPRPIFSAADDPAPTRQAPVSGERASAPDSMPATRPTPRPIPATTAAATTTSGAASSAAAVSSPPPAIPVTAVSPALPAAAAAPAGSAGRVHRPREVDLSRGPGSAPTSGPTGEAVRRQPSPASSRPDSGLGGSDSLPQRRVPGASGAGSNASPRPPADGRLPKRNPAPVTAGGDPSGGLPKRGISEAETAAGTPFNLFGGTAEQPARRRSLGDFASGVRQVRGDGQPTDPEDGGEG